MYKERCVVRERIIVRQVGELVAVVGASGGCQADAQGRSPVRIAALACKVTKLPTQNSQRSW